MESSVGNDEKKEGLRSWAIVLAIAFSFIAWGLLIFFSVGDKGAPNWDFSVVEDIPGQSVYSTHSIPPFTPGGSYEPQPGEAVPGQHVDGPEGDETRVLGLEQKVKP